MRSPVATVIAPVHANNFAQGRTWPGAVDVIVIHVTEGSALSVKQWFNDPAAVVSAHYMVQRDGTVVSFVDENDRAYHAGQLVSPTAPLVIQRHANGGYTPNSYGIGIEHEGDGTQELTDAQRAASYALIRDIRTRHAVPLDRTHIIGHHEIKASKTCPGAISVDRIVADLAAQAAPAQEYPQVLLSPSLGPIIPLSIQDDDHWTFVTLDDVQRAVRTNSTLQPRTAGTSLTDPQLTLVI